MVLVKRETYMVSNKLYLDIIKEIMSSIHKDEMIKSYAKTYTRVSANIDSLKGVIIRELLSRFE